MAIFVYGHAAGRTRPASEIGDDQSVGAVACEVDDVVGRRRRGSTAVALHRRREETTVNAEVAIVAVAVGPSGAAERSLGRRRELLRPSGAVGIVGAPGGGPAGDGHVHGDARPDDDGGARERRQRHEAEELLGEAERRRHVAAQLRNGARFVARVPRFVARLARLVARAARFVARPAAPLDSRLARVARHSRLLSSRLAPQFSQSHLAGGCGS